MIGRNSEENDVFYLGTMSVATRNDASVAESRKSDHMNENIEEASCYSFKDCGDGVIVNLFEDGSNPASFRKIPNSQN